MIRRLRLVLPSAESIAVYVLLYAFAALPALIYVRRVGGPVPRESYAPLKLLHAFGLVAYGAYRVVAFHPFFRSGYRHWLEGTPWTWRKPLPLGPIRLGWEDAVVLVGAGAPLWAACDFSPLDSLLILLAPYVLLLSLASSQTGARASAYLVGFGVGVVARLWGTAPVAMAVAVALVYAVAIFGLVRSLRRWPWVIDWQAEMARRTQSEEHPSLSRRLGWPYDRLGPKFPALGRAPLRSLDVVLISLLAGWWLDIALSRVPIPLPAVMTILGEVTMLGVVARLGSYVSGYAPPINLWGRIVSLRWIIPSYDQVWVAPLSAVAALCLPAGLSAAGLPVHLAAAITVSLILLVLLLGPPSRREWWLTARHRVVPTGRASGGFVEVG